MAVLRAIVTESGALRPIDEMSRQELRFWCPFITLKTATFPFMARIFYVHWNECEASERITPMVEAGHGVWAHWSTGSSPSLKGELPDAVVISLDRLPSHGRAVAEWFWEAKSRRRIPIVFEGGKPEKVAVARERFPEALFCDAGQAVDLLDILKTEVRE